MFLKKTFPSFSRMGFYKMIYEDEADLMDGILYLCHVLEKTRFAIRIYPVPNDITLTQGYLGQFEYKRVNYFLLDDVGFLRDIHLSALRHLNIVPVSAESPMLDAIKSALKKPSFCIWLDNYLESTDLTIDFRQYDSSAQRMIQKLMK